MPQENHSHETEAAPDTICLDFANTAGDHASDCPNEYLQSYADLIQWAEKAGLLRGETAEQLLLEAGQEQPEANPALVKAIELRETIYRIFTAHAQGTDVNPIDLDILNRCLSEAMAHPRIRLDGQHFSMGWEEPLNSLDQILWPVARSAANLLTSPLLDRVGQCASDTCGWLFLDMSKNRKRRWCDMRDCGNRAKARRHYAKIQGLATE